MQNKTSTIVLHDTAYIEKVIPKIEIVHDTVKIVDQELKAHPYKKEKIEELLPTSLVPLKDNINIQNSLIRVLGKDELQQGLMHISGKSMLEDTLQIYLPILSI